MVSPNRIKGLDGVRAISIGIVIACHAAGWPIGHIGVKIFFILSGFLITWLLCVEEDRNGRISRAWFYTRRALRILPPAFAFLAVVYLLARIGLSDASFGDVLASALFVRNVAGQGNQTAHFWSLAIEEQFYLLWPLSFIWLRSNRNRLTVASALFLLAPFYRQLVVRLAGGAAYVNPSRFDVAYDPILAGCCLALARHQFPWMRGRWASSGPLALVAVALAAASQVFQFPHRAFSETMFCCAASYLVNYVVECAGPVDVALNWAPVAWVGRLSYSLYLWQQLFLWFPKFGWLGRFPQNVVATFVMAAGSYYIIEQPSLALRKRLERRFGKRPRSAENVASSDLVALHGGSRVQVSAVGAEGLHARRVSGG